MGGEDFRDARTAHIGERDMVGDLKASLFAHGLHLGNQLAHETFLNERFGQVRVKHHGKLMLRLAYKACFLHGLG